MVPEDRNPDATTQDSLANAPSDLKKETLTVVFELIDPIIDRFIPESRGLLRRVARLGVLAAFTGAVAAFVAWGVPYFKSAGATVLTDWQLPSADENRVSILIANFSNDTDNALAARIESAIKEDIGQRYVEPLLAGEELARGAQGSEESLDQKAAQRGRAMLRYSHADVLIWGTRLNSSSGDAVDIHFLTPQSQYAGNVPYQLMPGLKIPANFDHDFGMVIGGIALSAATPAKEKGSFVVDILRPVEKRLSSLSTSSLGKGSTQLNIKIQDSYGLVSLAIGRQAGDTESLRRAVSAFRNEIELLGSNGDSNARADAHNNLGVALRLLGDRNPEEDYENLAIEQFQISLRTRKKNVAPLEWSATQDQLGNAYRALAERSGDPEMFGKAITAFLYAANERARRLSPLNWAQSQNDLGTALRVLGNRTKDVAVQERAVAAYRRALEEWTVQRAPLDWATAQNNLGTVLENIGESRGSAQELEAAVATFRRVLTQRRRQQVPIDWAVTQLNLGYALRALGERDGDYVRFEQSLNAISDAMLELPLERAPTRWAQAQNYLGMSLASYGTREHRAGRLNAAIAAFRAALVVYQREGARGYYTKWVTANLAAAQKNLASIKKEYPNLN